MKDIEASLSEDEKAKINSAKDALAKALEGNNTQEIKEKTDALTEEFHTISAKMYQQAQQAQGGAGFDPGAAGFNPGNMGGADAADDAQARPDNVVDADYEVVDDNK